MSWYGGYGDWKPYVPVAKRRANATKYAEKLAKKEKRTLSPVKIEGRKIAKSFWGLAWCDNLERYSDYANRLPRGGTYVRNGSVIDLQIGKGTIKALVSGSEVYTVTIKIETLAAAAWLKIKRDCSQSIDSLLDLVQGKFDRGIMDRLTQKEGGLFPPPKEIKLSCSCPDSVGMCKHIAAAMYGVGHRLDSAPELLFLLRAVDHLELIADAVSSENLERTLASDQESGLGASDLGELFGIELDLGGADINDVALPIKEAAAPKTRRKKSIKVVDASVDSSDLAKKRNQVADTTRSPGLSDTILGSANAKAKTTRKATKAIVSAELKEIAKAPQPVAAKSSRTKTSKTTAAKTASSAANKPSQTRKAK